MPTDIPATPQVPPAGQPRAPFLNRLFDAPDLSAVTGLRWARPASHLQRPIARGGLLYMDEHKLGFEPRGIDALLGARAMTWELSSITGLTLKPTLRKLRVTLTTAAGKQRFIVSNPAVVFNDLNAWHRRHSEFARSDGVPPAAEEGGASA